MAEVIISEAAVRIQVDSAGAEDDAARSGALAGTAFADAADHGSKGALQDAIKQSGPQLTADAEVAGDAAGKGFKDKFKDQTKNMPAADVPINALDAAFKRQVADAVKVVEKNAANIPLNADGEALRTKVSAQIKEIQDTLKVQIPTEPGDAVEYRRKLAEMVKVASAGVTANVKVDTDTSALSKLTSAFKDLIGVGKGVDDTFKSMTGSGDGAGGMIKNLIGLSANGLKPAMSSLGGSIASTAASVGLLALKAPLMAGAITLGAGAAVSAVGALVAIIGSVPPLLLGIGAPLLAFSLGMDGLKTAAVNLVKPFNDLKVAVNTAFANDFRPVFDSLQGVIKSVNFGLVGIIAELSHFAGDLANVINTVEGTRKIETALAGVQTFLDGVREGAVSAFNAVLNILATQDLYRIWGEIVGGALLRVGDLFNELATGNELVPAMQQVRDVLLTVVDLVVQLAHGSLTFFTAAGPGLTAFFRDMGNLISKIDWKSLGNAFAGMLERLGAAIVAIPPDKWQAIADSIGALAQKFVDWVASGGIPNLITALAGFVSILLDISGAIEGLIKGIDGLNKYLDSIQNFFYDNFTKPTIDAAQALASFFGIASPAQWFIDLGHNIVAGFIGGLEDRIGDVLGFFADLPGRIVGALGDLAGRMLQAGADAVAGFVRGIEGAISSAASAAARMAQEAWDAAKSVLGISSPSTVFADIGSNTVEGFLQGLQGRMTEILPLLRQVFAQVAAQAGNVDISGLLSPLSLTGTADVTGIGAGLPQFPTAQAIQAAMTTALQQAQWKVSGRDLALTVNNANSWAATR
jgi:hypothetical protein